MTTDVTQLTTEPNIHSADNNAEHPCDQCSMQFASPQGLSLHKMRKHGKLQGNTLRFKKAKRKQSWTSKRECYLRYRDKNYAAGLNARGKPFKLSPAGVTAIQQAQRERRAREKRSGLPRPRRDGRLKTRHIVFPAPAAEQQAPAADLNSTAVNYCPHCGTNIRKYLQ